MLTKEISEALELLRDENLVWSSDFEDVRLDLANLILVSAAQGDMMQSLADTIAKKIVYSNKGSIYDPKLEKR
jgi:hypothetical protein